VPSTQEALDTVGVVHAGQLHDDAADALALDRRLGGAGLVDAAAHHLDRLLHRVGGAQIGGRFAQSDADVGAVGLDGDVGLAQAEGAGLHRHRQRVDLGQRGRDLRCITDRQPHHVVVADGKTGVADEVLAQRRSDIVDDRRQALAHDGARIDLKQQMRAAAQVQSEVDFPAGEPARHSLQGALRQEVRQQVKEARKDDGQYDADLPARKEQH
jgi:hypothetical protein